MQYTKYTWPSFEFERYLTASSGKQNASVLTCIQQTLVLSGHAVQISKVSAK